MMLNRNILRKIKYSLIHKAVILMYHRIDHLAFDPWQLAVSPANFEEQLQVLKDKFDVIPLTKLPTRIKQKSIQSKSVCITFDDGYTDNYIHAKPLLEKYNCAATFFVATDYIGKEQQYWWDELQNIILPPLQLPSSISIIINGTRFSFTLPNDGKISQEELQKQSSWYYEEEPVTHRCELYLKLWERLKPLPYDQISEKILEIKNWAGGEGAIDRSSFPMSLSQLSELANHSLISLGVHTMSHLSLPAHDVAEQEREISGNKQYLEKLCGKEIQTMAYPYGDYNELTLEATKKQRLALAVTTEEKVVTHRSLPHQYGRFQVKNWNGEEFERHLRTWIRGY